MKQLLKRMIVPIMFLFMGITACAPATRGNGGSSSIPVTGVTLDRTELVLGAGSSARLTATITPENADEPGLRWKSSRTDIATVDSDGFITAKAKGSTVISVTTLDGGFVAESALTVTDPIAVTGVSLDKTELDIGIGSILQLNASVIPGNAAQQELTWTSSNPDTVSVNDNGLVTAKSAGTAIITVKTVDGGYSAVCEVTVLNAFTVHFETNGGSSIEDMIVLEGKIPTLPDNPTREGYYFYGWYADAALNTVWNSDQAISAATTIYANWQIITYNISYILNGGTQDNRNPEEYTIENSALTIYPANRDSYVFTGWFSDQNFTSDSKMEFIPSGTTGNITLYAQWTPTHQLTYYSNNGSGDGIMRTMGEGIPEALKPNNFTFHGYTFVGWAESPSATDPDYVDEELYTMGTSDAALYAVWKSWYTVSENTITGFSENWDGTADLVIPSDIKGVTIKAIAGKAFYQNTEIESVTINTSVSNYEIGYYAFAYNTKLEEVNITSLSDIDINEGVFYNCTSLTKVHLPDSMKIISNCTFQNCTSLSDINIPAQCQRIYTEAFQNCQSLTEVTLSNNMITLGDLAFSGCSSLTTFTIPEKLYEISKMAFSNCTSLTTLNIHETTPPRSSSTNLQLFVNCPSDLKIYVPAASVNTYKTDSIWSDYSSQIFALP